MPQTGQEQDTPAPTAAMSSDAHPRRRATRPLTSGRVP